MTLAALSLAGLLGPPGGPKVWEDHQVKAPASTGRPGPWESLPCNRITEGATVKCPFYDCKSSVSFLLAPCKHLECPRSQAQEAGQPDGG